ncbi:MAG TPA: DUF4019 domain-containing protein [Geothermobacteraceae bacterium]|nr:DUF4019 domain-containing protein [Geothermobacteraceae bacterium]
MSHALTVSRNVRIHMFLLIASLLWIIVPAINKAPSQEVRQASIQAAAQFLFLIDTEEYAKSWEVTSDSLKHILSQKTWNKQISKIRSFLGPIVDRIHQDIAYTSNATDIPEGEYVVMTFISQFELRERVIETITLMLSSDNQWQVAGYFLR